MTGSTTGAPRKRANSPSPRSSICAPSAWRMATRPVCQPLGRFCGPLLSPRAVTHAHVPLSGLFFFVPSLRLRSFLGCGASWRCPRWALLCHCSRLYRTRCVADCQVAAPCCVVLPPVTHPHEQISSFGPVHRSLGKQGRQVAHKRPNRGWERLVAQGEEENPRY